jgi:hypothetical protein
MERGVARVEFYESGKDPGLITAMDCSAVPRAGEIVNIKKKNWQVDRVTWCVDDADDIRPSLRACVELKPRTI